MSRLSLRNVRIAYPRLLEKNIYNGLETKYEAWFLIPKNSEQVRPILEKIEEFYKEIKSKLPAERVCLKDGDRQDSKDYEKGHYILKSSNNDMPIVLDQYKRPCKDKADNPIYSGCHVNVSLNLWLQNNKYGKLINSNLFAVMFSKDGERIGGARPSINEINSDFDDIKPAEDDLPF